MDTHKNFISSHELAILINRGHKDIRRAIRNIILKNSNNHSEFEDGFYINYQNKKQPTYKLSLTGVKLYIDNARKTPNLKPLIEWYNTAEGSNSNPIVLNSRFEDSFISDLEQSLKPLGYKIDKQKPILNKYRLDAYIEDLNIAIEYDEKQHEYNSEKDLIRQREIEKHLNCSFIRCNYTETNSYNIGLVFNEILSKHKVA